MSRETEEMLKAQLVEAKKALQEYESIIKRLSSPPFSLATVLATNKNMALVSVDGKMIYSESPEGSKLKPGDVVFANPETGALVKVTEEVRLPGNIANVRKVNGTEIELDIEGKQRFAQSGTKVEVGDRVIVDESFSVVYRNLGKQDDTFAFQAETGVTWGDIGGLEEAKTALVEAVEVPFKHKDLYKAYGRKITKGILLYGPPGCGKTMLGKATATALAKVHGKKSSTGFIYVKGPEILNKYVGESEATIRSLFKSTREHFYKHGYPAVLFIDEADAILHSRDLSHNGISMSTTIVPMFLAEMDGLEESGAMVLLSTNRPQDLDPAIIRDGRVDKKVKVTRPDRDNTESIFELYLKGVPTKEQELGQYGANEMFAASRHMFEIAMKNGATTTLALRHLSNGGLIAGVVERAKELAMQRDISDKVKTCRGVQKVDIKGAIDASMLQMMDIDHSHAIEELVGDLRQVKEVRKIRSAAVTV